MSSFGSYVSWEWQRNDGGFCPYIPEASAGIEAAFSTGKGQFQVHPYTIDFATMTQHKYGGRTRRVKRSVVNLGPGPDLTAYWRWCECPGQFVCYQVEASADIERAFQTKVDIVNLSKCSSQLPYTVNFKNMNQTRHHYNTKRPIERIPLSTGHSLQSFLKAGSLPPGSAGGAPLGRSVYGPGGTPGVVALSHPSMVNARPSSMSTSGYSATHSTMNSAGHVLPPTTHHSFGTASTFGTSHPGHAHTTVHGYYPPTVNAATNVYPNWSTPTLNPSSMGFSSASFHSTASPSVHHPSTMTNATGMTQSTTSQSPSMTTRSKSKSTTKASKSASTTTASRKSAGATAGSKTSKGKARTRTRKNKTVPHDSLSAYARKVNRLKPKHDEACPICMNMLSEVSGFEDDDTLPTSTESVPLNVYRLRKCGHKLHYPCLTMYIKNSSKSGFQCPTCKKPYGARTGDMPDGTMTVHVQGSSLPGHPGEGTIQIIYNFTPGHYNGRRYRTNGFPRVCYLPNSAKGQKVLKLLRVAWERRLTFTIGTSVTTGTTDTVVWNEIHHKTESHSNSSGHGYPDPTYLDRVLLELAAQGVEDKQEEEDEEVESTDSSSDEEEPATTAKLAATKPIRKPAAEIVDLSDSDSL